MSVSFSDVVPIIVGIITITAIVYITSKDMTKALTVFGSWGLYEFCNFFYDVPLWSYVQEKYGIWGSVWLVFGAGVMNLAFLYMYLHGKKDLFGFDTVQKTGKIISTWSGRNVDGKGIKKLISVIVRWIARKDDIIAFFVLSVVMDSFVVTIYLRHGSFSPKVEKKDWMIFVSSTLFSGIVWGLFVEVLLVIFKTILNFF